MTNTEMIAQLEAELKSLKAALAACTPKTDPALVASLKKAIATLERIIADLKSGQKPEGSRQLLPLRACILRLTRHGTEGVGSDRSAHVSAARG